MRGRYDGNWNAEPLALARMQASAADLAAMRVEDRALSEIADLEPAPHLVVVTGVDAHDFTGDEGE